ncbi:MAG: hypothetical protein GY938_32335 [Ketobacter sp.]|nr:hypothetical protein [Ketobacter sp.]
MDQTQKFHERKFDCLLNDPEFGESDFMVIEEELRKAPSYIDVYVQKLGLPLSNANRELLCFIIIKHLPLAPCVDFLRNDPDWREQGFYELDWCNTEEDLETPMTMEEYEVWLKEQMKLDGRV